MPAFIGIFKESPIGWVWHHNPRLKATRVAQYFANVRMGHRISSVNEMESYL